MSFQKTCEYEPCSKPFVAIYSKARFCGMVCAGKAQPRHAKNRFEKVCAYKPCGKPFITKNLKAKYCSLQCNGQARAHKPKQWKEYLLHRIQMPETPEGCWIWIGALDDKGYGRACERGRTILAHRQVYEVFVGRIPEEMHLLHGKTCVTRACVNPFHLRFGTNVENIQDRIEWGNHRQGSLTQQAQFTEIQVLHILQDFHNKKMPVNEIAKQRGKKRQTITDIVFRRTWKHVAPGLYPAPLPKPFRRQPSAFPLLHVCPNTGPYCSACGECLTCFAQDRCEMTDDHTHITP